MKTHLFIEKRGFTISHFARLAGVPIPTMWKIVTQRNYNPTMATVSKICKAAKGHITPKDFMPEVPNETAQN